MSDEPIVRVYPRSSTDGHLADAMTYFADHELRAAADRRAAEGDRWDRESWDIEPYFRMPTTYRIDLAAARQGVRSEEWRQKFHDQLAAIRKRAVEKIENEAAYLILEEALLRIDELEAQLSGKGNAPALGGRARFPGEDGTTG